LSQRICAPKSCCEASQDMPDRCSRARRQAMLDPFERLLNSPPGVIDTGIGIDEKHIDRIFLPHVRLEDAAGRHPEGSGLGLTIVQRLVSSLGGSLRVESDLSDGTNFQVTVPGLVDG